MTRKAKTNWLERALIQGPYLALFTSKKAFQDECKALNVSDGAPRFVSKGAGATVHHLEMNDGREIAMVCIDMKNSLTYTRLQVYTLLVHEAVHIYQHVRDFMNEAKPSIEFEAYAIQTLSHTLIDEYERQRKAYKCKTKKSKTSTRS